MGIISILLLLLPGAIGHDIQVMWEKGLYDENGGGVYGFDMGAGDVNGRIKRVHKEWQRRHGAFSPMIGGEGEEVELTGFEPMLGGGRRPSGEDQE